MNKYTKRNILHFAFVFLRHVQEGQKIKCTIKSTDFQMSKNVPSSHLKNATKCTQSNIIHVSHFAFVFPMSLGFIIHSAVCLFLCSSLPIQERNDNKLDLTGRPTGIIPAHNTSGGTTHPSVI